MRLLAVLFLALGSGAFAADLAKVDRSIHKEPKYSGKPKYCLFVFGPEAKHRVWLVQDGAKLYVDKNGNGDLTDEGEKIAAQKEEHGGVEGMEGFSYEVGDVKVGGKTHKGLTVGLMPLKSLTRNQNLMEIPAIASAIRKSPDAVTTAINIDVECTTIRSSGPGGRVGYMLMVFDTRGVLQLADKPAMAPIIHFDGPLEVDFFGTKPTWIGGRSHDAILCVGTSGAGPGTFAMIRYEDTIPAGKHPILTATYQSKSAPDKPFKEQYELKERC